MNILSARNSERTSIHDYVAEAFSAALLVLSGVLAMITFASI